MRTVFRIISSSHLAHTYTHTNPRLKITQLAQYARLKPPAHDAIFFAGLLACACAGNLALLLGWKLCVCWSRYFSCYNPALSIKDTVNLKFGLDCKIHVKKYLK